MILGVWSLDYGSHYLAWRVSDGGFNLLLLGLFGAFWGTAWALEALILSLQGPWAAVCG